MSDPRVVADQELASWALVRRYAVPRWMIERATERRLAGDWRGACAAAHIDVDIDPADLTPQIEDDLRHLAPDLLRWHAPRVRYGRAELSPRQGLVLGRYGDAVLCAATPLHHDGAQRLRLRLVPADPRPSEADVQRVDWTGLRHLWDARRSAELLAHCGGGDRPPFFHADGTPLAPEELPDRDPGGGDPVRHAEWVGLLHERGALREASAAAGLVFGEAEKTWTWAEERWQRRLTVAPVDLALLERTARSSSRDLRVDLFWDLSLTVEGGGGVITVFAIDPFPLPQGPPLADGLWRRLPDLDLLRAGRITPEELHPLVRDALFPARPPADGPVGPPGPALPVPVAVPCRRRQHGLRFRDGVLEDSHTPRERDRERALRAFGGAPSGCFAVRTAWEDGRGRLPGALLRLRKDLFRRMEHGDTPGVLRLLDAGVDPRVRDRGGRTLLHLVHRVDHEVLLPRLLAAGVDPRSRDHLNRTPAWTVQYAGGPRALVRALDAAELDAAQHDEETV
ncbi:ankyrin repeat domain-containing protein [Actinomadura kijaniata]|uniref:ankyrin repeat domain-containing protein n=1 Tax=Actinomadura kijaniata TaxID=46161 RepID=UPI00082EE7B2|nr:ankyrin repeat domain-containing protein [Actinomadura kijaniata]